MNLWRFSGQWQNCCGKQIKFQKTAKEYPKVSDKYIETKNKVAIDANHGREARYRKIRREIPGYYSNWTGNIRFLLHTAEQGRAAGENKEKCF